MSSFLEDKLKFWRTGGSFGGHLEDKPILTSFLEVPDKFGDFGASLGIFAVSVSNC